MKRRLAALAVAVSMLGSLAGCGGAGNQSGGQTAVSQAPAGNTMAEGTAGGGESIVNIAMTTTMGDLDPFGAPTQGRNFLRYAVYENIAMFKDFGTTWEDMEWVLAKNITQEDEVTYRIELYDYIHDALGNPVKADDLVFCLNGMAESGNFTRFTNYMESATALDENTVEIKLKTTIIGAIEYIFAQCCVVSQKTYEEHKDQYSTVPITTAAYQVKECVSGSYYVLEKNEDYWQTDESKRSYVSKQQVDKFRYNVITENSQATIALQMGEDQIITVVGNSEIGFFADENKNPLPGYNLNKLLSTTSTILSFNMDAQESVFADNLPLRQAVCYAISPEGIIKAGVGGNAEKMNDLAPKGCGDYNKEWDSSDYFDYDLDKAKALMVEAGYPDGIDPATGQPLNLTLMVDQRYKDEAVVLQSQLLQIGINLEVSALDNSLVSSYQYDPSKWDMYQFIQGTECYVTSVYDGIFEANTEGKAPKSFVVDDKLQELIKESHDVKTHSQETVDALHDYVKDNAYAYGLYQLYTYTVSIDSIKPVNHPWGQLVGPACDFTDYIGK